MSFQRRVEQERQSILNERRYDESERQRIERSKAREREVVEIALNEALSRANGLLQQQPAYKRIKSTIEHPELHAALRLYWENVKPKVWKYGSGFLRLGGGQVRRRVPFSLSSSLPEIKENTLGLKRIVEVIPAHRSTSIALVSINHDEETKVKYVPTPPMDGTRFGYIDDELINDCIPLALARGGKIHLDLGDVKTWHSGPGGRQGGAGYGYSSHYLHIVANFTDKFSISFRSKSFESIEPLLDLLSTEIAKSSLRS